MIDLSKWLAIEESLECVPGKGTVNSSSLAVGEEEFLWRGQVPTGHDEARKISVRFVKGRRRHIHE